MTSQNDSNEKPYDIRERTFLFAVKTLKWVRTLPKDMGTQIAAKQLVAATTPVGANVEILSSLSAKGKCSLNAN